MYCQPLNTLVEASVLERGAQLRLSIQQSASCDPYRYGDLLALLNFSVVSDALGLAAILTRLPEFHPHFRGGDQYSSIGKVCQGMSTNANAPSARHPANPQIFRIALMIQHGQGRISQDSGHQ